EAGHATGKAESAYVRARSGLSQAIENLDATKSGAVYRFLASTRFCVAVLMLEVWNVSSESDAFGQTTREKNRGRASAGIAAAIVDLAIAAEALAIKSMGIQSKAALTRKIVMHISEASATKWIGPALGAALTKQISIRIGAQILSAVLLVGVNLYDAYHAWKWNDPAMYGYLMMAAGGSAALLSSVFGGMATVLGLTPLGWIALLLIGVGVTQVLMQTSSPMETWLKNGPFGESHSKAEHLQEPLEAFYRLISLLAGISITTGKNPVYEPQARLNFRADIPHAIRSANTIVRIESRLPGLMGRLDSLSINAECKLICFNGRFDNQGMHRETPEPSEYSQPPLGQRLSSGILELFFYTPENINATAWSSTTRRFAWAVRAQFILIRGNEKRYLPAPPIKENTRYDESRAKPNFEKTINHFGLTRLRMEQRPND
ncbi:hypothetical protein V2K16_23255, partial [Pseudomonas alliivorans]|nr:hypothetical protein [Pseudomonas alliivorans]MEE4932595.1 hypothetical protein [Pseudomonas alliivorans]MEE4936703.1 hypothetical protein [Pseudomonas alliivorans]MEE4941279.1 hypothetical protein [Pseudomonas alliivorans]MEE4952811.1 hypothetical protein [Pseudomonas alliivorans]